MSPPTRPSLFPLDKIERREPSPASRVPLRVPVSYRSVAGDVWGEGTSWNLSTSGALVEHATRPVALGTELLLWFSLYPGSTGTALPGTVTRLTERGFAVRFGKLDDEQAYLLKRALPDGA
jgi:hypothetical protein